MSTFTKLSTFQGKSSFGTWLYQVTYTHCIDYIRNIKNKYKEELQEGKIEDISSEDTDMDGVHEKVIL